MAHPSAAPSAGAEAASSCRSTSSAAPKLTCLCSPTNHPGSFRCSRHRTPRARPLQSSSSTARASLLQQAAAPAMKSGGGSRTPSKGRPALRAHLQRLLASPQPFSGGRDQRRCREFKPRLSRLGRLAAVTS